jgi:uncharacterized protein YbjT (DUF2867 family)
MRVLVLGGTGVAGRQTVAELRRRGHQVRILSRRAGVAAEPAGAGAVVERVVGDLATGAGLAEALAGVDTVVDAANFETMRYRRAARQFETSMRLIGDLGRAAGVRHLVVLSIVGVDKAPYGYYGVKLRHERAALAGPIPATVVRATQFHDFPAQVLDRLRVGPIALVPSMLTQPVATTQVAAALADAVDAGPAATGYAPDVGGPRVERLPDLARRLVRRRGQRIRTVAVRLPGAWGRAIRRGDALLAGDVAGRGPTYDEWLERNPTGWTVPTAQATDQPG